MVIFTVNLNRNIHPYGIAKKGKDATIVNNQSGRSLRCVHTHPTRLFT